MFAFVPTDFTLTFPLCKVFKGQTIRKVMGGVGKKTKKFHARENAKEKIRAKKKVKKKNSCSRKVQLTLIEYVKFASVHKNNSL